MPYRREIIAFAASGLLNACGVAWMLCREHIARVVAWHGVDWYWINQRDSAALTAVVLGGIMMFVSGAALMAGKAVDAAEDSIEASDRKVE